MMEVLMFQWLREVGTQGKCPSKEKTDVGFRCFQGPHNRERQAFAWRDQGLSLFVNFS
jgi:hypothetical protein